MRQKFAALLLCAGLALAAPACSPRKPAPPSAAYVARLERQADSLRQLAGWQQIQLTEYDSAQARTRRELKTYPSRYEQIRTTTAADWPATRLERFLSDYREPR